MRSEQQGSRKQQHFDSVYTGGAYTSFSPQEVEYQTVDGRAKPNRQMKTVPYLAELSGYVVP
jgi:hypothetical protein